jgi:hypothetical protein
MMEFQTSTLLIALAVMILIQGGAVINGKKFGGVLISYAIGTIIGASVFWGLLIILPQVM